MRVLVTGAGGHFGSHLVTRLLQQGEEVIGVDCLRYGGNGLLGSFSHPSFRFEQLDIRDGLNGSFHGVDWVVHLAALVGPVCEQDPSLTWETNVEATRRLCGWARENGVRLLLASTCSNYGKSDGLATEDHPLTPLGAYAKSKVAAEQAVADLLPESVTLRLATLAGLSPRPRFDTLLNHLVTQAWEQGEITCYQPRARRPFLHLEDAVRAIRTLLQKAPRSKRLCYNVVGFNTSVGELAQLIQQRTGCRVVESAAVTDGRDYSVSAELIARDTGFRPQLSAAQCVEQVYTALQMGLVKPGKEHSNV